MTKAGEWLADRGRWIRDKVGDHPMATVGAVVGGTLLSVAGPLGTATGIGIGASVGNVFDQTPKQKAEKEAAATVVKVHGLIGLDMSKGTTMADTASNTTVTATKPVDIKTPTGRADVTVEVAKGWENWKTLAFNGGIAGGLAILTWASTVDWTQYVSPTVAMFIVLGVNTVLRALPSGPMGSGVVIKKQ
jgi:hypothetical protein